MSKNNSTTRWDGELKAKHEENISKQKRTYPYSFKYFENRACEFFPCHPDATDGHNCMFCRCPLYKNPVCPGTEDGTAITLDNGVKDCTNCEWNHRYNNSEFLSRYSGE